MVAAMWFDAQAALKNLDGAEQPRSNTANPAEPKPVRVAGVAVVAGCGAENPEARASRNEPRVASVADVAAGRAGNSKIGLSATRAETDFPYGASPGGRPLTWTGRVVSLEAWRTLTEWERHGPQRRHWCGVKSAWIEKSEV